MDRFMALVEIKAGEMRQMLDGGALFNEIFYRVSLPAS